MSDIVATDADAYYILRHNDGTTNVGTTPAGCVTAYSPALWYEVWTGTDRAEWVRTCESLGLDVPGTKPSDQGSVYE